MSLNDRLRKLERTHARPPYTGATLIIGPCRNDDATGPVPGAHVWKLNANDWDRLGELLPAGERGRVYLPPVDTLDTLPEDFDDEP